jgi:hypothetical protein
MGETEIVAHKVKVKRFKSSTSNGLFGSRVIFEGKSNDFF